MPKLTERPEADLVERIARGDPEAIRSLDRWIDPVLREGFRSLEADWEDLRQEVRARVYRNLSRGYFDGRSALSTYVHRIAKNVCIDSSRLARRRRERSLADQNFANLRTDKPGVHRGLAAREVIELLMRDLPEGDRLLVRLIFLEHQSYGEVARRLGISRGAVKSRMFRCKSRLLKRRREILEP